MYDKAESTKKLKIRFSINGVPSIFTILKFKRVVDNSKFLVPPTSFYDGSTAGLGDSLLVTWEEKKANLAELPLKCKYRTGYIKAFWFCRNVPGCSDLRHYNNAVRENSCYFRFPSLILTWCMVSLPM